MKPTFYGEIVTSNRILYTASPFAMEHLIYLQETGTLQARKAHTNRRMLLSSYLFFVVQSGSGKLEYNAETYHLQTGDCVFINCMSPYSHTTSPEDLWKLQWVHFQGTAMEGIYAKYVERGGRPCFHPQDIAPFIQCLNHIYDTADSEEYVRDMILFEDFSSLLTLIMKESWHPETVAFKRKEVGTTADADAAASVAAAGGADSETDGSWKLRDYNLTKKERLQEIKNYLDTHYRESEGLEELAQRFYINKFYLARIFREAYGISIHTYLMQLRITDAKRLLRFTNNSMKTIGTACGFSDANYFSRCFKKVEGISPGSYRRMWQG